MNKKYNRIVLDIDNTITDLQTTLDIISYKMDRPKVLIEDIHSFQLAKAFNMTLEEEQYLWNTYENFIAQHSKLAKERTLTMLDTYTHNDTIIDVVTMRPESAYHTTKKHPKQCTI